MKLLIILALVFAVSAGAADALYFALYEDDGASAGYTEGKTSDASWKELYASEKTLTIEQWNAAIVKGTTGRKNPRITAIFSDESGTVGKPICVIDDIGALTITDRIKAVTNANRIK